MVDVESETYYHMLYHSVRPDVIVVLTNGVDELRDLLVDIPVKRIYLSGDILEPETSEDTDEVFIPLVRKITNEMNDLELIEHTLHYLLNAGYIGSKDLVMCVLNTKTMENISIIEMSNMKTPSIKDKLREEISPELVDVILSLGYNIVRKGREGVNPGAIFIVGRMDELGPHVFLPEINPFSALDKSKRSILDPGNASHIMEFAMLDGATVVDPNGYVTASGVYVKISENTYLNRLGGRHLAAYSITRNSNSVAFLVSSEGEIKVYFRGDEIKTISIR